MKKIIVLAGGADQIGLIENLKKRGYYTILLDYYENPVAKKFADKHIQVSTLDKESVLNIAVEQKVENIITACTDQALLTVAYVAEKLGFITQFTYEEALRVTNKQFMKSIMWDNNIPTSRFRIINSSNEGLGDLRFPVMIKPANCNGSLGVKKAYNDIQFNTFFCEALGYSRTHNVIVEEFVEGDEISVDCIIINKKAKVIMMSMVKKYKVDENTSIILQTQTPPSISDKAEQNIKDIANKIAIAFNLNNTPLLIQVIIKDDNVNVIEFAPRIGGGLKHKSIKEITGFDILNANIDCILGKNVNIELYKSNYHYARCHIYTRPCIYDRVENAGFIVSKGIIEEYVEYKSKGMIVGEASASRDRVGSFLCKAKNTKELDKKIREAISTLAIIDSKGQNVIRKDMYFS